MRCSGCDHDNPDDARFCASCGAALRSTCPACGAATSPQQSFCTACGQALRGPAPAAQPSYQPAEEGERRQVTIVFSDLSGYTALNERLDPEEVEDVMVRIRAAANRIIGRHGGTVNQFVGDEVVALFGMPVARRDDARRAVQAALELHHAVRKIGADVAARIGGALTMHTGINTGTIVTRRSDARHGQYAITGDAVNTGARLLGLAAADEVVIGQDTWRQVSECFDAIAGAPVEVKGKERPVIPYRIVGERCGNARPRPLAGRTRELRQISALLHSCADEGRGCVLVVRGDPGIGKSRLMQEAIAIATNEGFAGHSALVLDFAERGRDAIGSLMRSLLGAAQDADEQSRRAAIVRAIDSGNAHPDHAVFLYDLLDLEPPPELRSLHAALDAPARSRGTLETVCDVTRRAATQQPLLLLVEDAHWADTWTLDRLAGLAGLTHSTPLLLALTTRPDDDPSLGTWGTSLPNGHVTRIDLGPLPPDAALELAAGYLRLPEDLTRSYIERAEGNPLFLEQLLLNAEEMSQTGVPGSIQGLVQARLDRLPGTDHFAVQAAAVLGQRFALDALRHLIDNGEYACDALLEHALLRREGSEFLFCHALIRDGAYESLLKSRRRELHARAGDWFATSDLALAAGHYERAGDARAPQTYHAAAAAEVARYRYGPALALAERGLALASAREDRFALRAMRAQILLDTGHPHDAIAAYDDALQVAHEPAERSRALIGMAAGMRIVDRVEEGLEQLAKAEPLARAAQRPLELSRLHHLRGNLYFGLGRAEDCLHEHEAALACARQADSAEAEALALSGLADAFYASGRMRSAHQQFQRCVDLCRSIGLGRMEVAVLHMSGWTGHYLFPQSQAIRMASECVEISARVSHHRAEMLAHLLLGYIEGWLIGNVETGVVHLDAALRLARHLDAKRFEGEITNYRALLDLRAGDRAGAISRARQGLDISRHHGRRFFAGTACGVLARVTDSDDEFAAACAEGEALLAEGCISHNYLEFHTLVAEAALEREDWPLVEHSCAELERFTQREPLPLIDLSVARARALVRHRRGERGRPLAAELLALRDETERLGVRLLLPQIDAALAVEPR